MKSVVNVAIVGLFAIALQANAQQANLIGQQAMQRMQQSAAAREFLANKLGVRSSSLTDANSALAKLNAGERAAILRAISKFDTKFQAGNNAANDALAREAFNTTAGADVLKAAAVAQGSANTAAVTAASKNVACGMKLTGAEMVVAGGQTAEKLQRAIDDGNLGDHNCKEPLRALPSTDQTKTAGNIAVCMSEKGAGPNTDQVTRLKINVECMQIVTGRSAEAAKASALAIAGVNNPEGCGWFTGGLVSADAARALQ